MKDQKKGFSVEELSGTAEYILRNFMPEPELYPNSNYDFTVEFAEKFGGLLEDLVAYCVKRRMPFAFMFYPFMAKNSHHSSGFHCGAAGTFKERGVGLRMILAEQVTKIDDEKELEDFVLDMAKAVNIKRKLESVSQEIDELENPIQSPDFDPITASQEIIDKMMQKK